MFCIIYEILLHIHKIYFAIIAIQYVGGVSNIISTTGSLKNLKCQPKSQQTVICGAKFLTSLAGPRLLQYKFLRRAPN